MISISNKHEEFFDYLIQNAENFERGAVLAHEVMSDISKLSDNMNEISQLEYRADETNQEVIHRLSRVFITPIDREDFYRLACVLEDCVDNIHGCLMRVSLYHIKQPTTASVKMASLLVLMGKELKNIFVLLKNTDKNEVALMEKTQHLSQLESDADALYREEISRIFEGNMPVLDVIKWKDIMNTFEESADHVERLSNIIKEVVMKYA